MSYGLESVVAVKKASAWGTAVACGANDGGKILSHSFKSVPAVLKDESLGQFVKGADLSNIQAGGNLVSWLRYDGLTDLLLAMIMGTAGAPAQQGGSTAYAYSYKIKNKLDGIFSTLAWLALPTVVHEYRSVKWRGFTIEGDAGQPLKITLEGLADKRVNDSSVNTYTTMANVTITEVGNRVLLSQGVFRLNDQAGSALADGDKIYPSKFTFSYKPNVKGEYLVPSAAALINCIDEPLADGFSEFSLKLDFPEYKAKTYIDNLDAGTEKKMDIKFTGGLIASTYYRQFNLTFPRLKVKAADVDLGGAAKIPHSIEFDLLQALSAPAGMTGITDPFQIDGINQRATDPLA